jgi:uncharacterized RDD family membrane protein YckC
MFLTKFLFKKFNCAPREDKLEYGYTIQRYLAILFDLCVMMVLAKYFQSFVMKMFSGWFNIVDFDILRKVQLQLPISIEEKNRIEIFKSRYLIMSASQFIIIPIYFGLSWYYLSGSFGQICLGLRIVSEDGSRITVKQIFKRIFAGVLTVATLMIGFLWSFVDKKRQSLHDKIAQTIIITKRSLQDEEKYDVRFDISDRVVTPLLKKVFIFIRGKFLQFRSRKS